jgi:hypothetical protein
VIGGAGESYPAFVILSTAEAECDPPDMFDDAVVALGAAVADGGDQAFDDRWLPGVHGPREPAELGYLGRRSTWP